MHNNCASKQFPKSKPFSVVINIPVFQLALCVHKFPLVCEKRNLLTDYSSQHVTGILGDGELYSEEKVGRAVKTKFCEEKHKLYDHCAKNMETTNKLREQLSAFGKY